MKRGAPLKRTAPLVSGKPLARTGTTPKRQKDTGPDKAMRQAVLARDRYACVACGVSIFAAGAFSLQHRKRRSQGGENTYANLICVCGTGSTGCHERIDSRRDPEDEARGYTVRSWKDPADVTVFVHGRGMPVWLTDDGRYAVTAPECVS